MSISNKTYDWLKWFALLAIPALATLVITVGKVWGLPYSEQIAATITAIGMFMGAVIRISTTKYNASDDGVDGDLIIDNATGNVYISASKLPSEMAEKSKVTLKTIAHQ